jgi:hypothetical protein
VGVRAQVLDHARESLEFSGADPDLHEAQRVAGETASKGHDPRIAKIRILAKAREAFGFAMGGMGGNRRWWWRRGEGRSERLPHRPLRDPPHAGSSIRQKEAPPLNLQNIALDRVHDLVDVAGEDPLSHGQPEPQRIGIGQRVNERRQLLFVYRRQGDGYPRIPGGSDDVVS